MRYQGKVKWFNPEKRYGFIQQDDSSKDIFVHMTALEEAGIKNLKEGQKVEFEVQDTNGKASAVKIKLI